MPSRPIPASRGAGAPGHQRATAAEPTSAPTANAVIRNPPSPGRPRSALSSTATVVSPPRPKKASVVAAVIARSFRTRHTAASPAARSAPSVGAPVAAG
ncbi:hypothetical protein ACH44C_12965 [Streptomyces purpureus]|uniref:hypothetical protein n=1 Tax=Streptomyces purpureus TaxID=1951 RepID=UPI0037917CAD